MMILVGIAVFVGGLLTATMWSAIRGTDRIRRRRGERPYAL
ncbi:MAG TPA: hypothetical protein VID20_00810 [Sphingomicrobium sp.]|jgi:hypothetical protein